MCFWYNKQYLQWTSWRFQRWGGYGDVSTLGPTNVMKCHVSRKFRTKNDSFLPGRVRHPFMIPQFWDLRTCNQSLLSFVHWILPPNSPFLRDLHIPFPPPLLTSPFLDSFPCFTASSVVPWSWPCSARCASSDLRSWCRSDFSHATRSPTVRSLVVGARDLVIPWISPKEERVGLGWGSIDGNSGVFLCDLKNWCYVKTWYILLFGVDVCGPISATAFVKFWKLCWDPSNPPWPTMMSDYNEG